VSSTEETVLPTKYGELNVQIFNGENGNYCLSVYKKPWTSPAFLRLHSGCLFGESLRATDCDCNQQLQESLKIISEEGGVVIYLFQEGRGLGLEGKIKAMEIERVKGVDTAKAFQLLGFNPDMRNYDLAIRAMISLGLPTEISLATNDPNKIKALEDNGFTVTRRKIKVKKNWAISKYLTMKQAVLNHYSDE
jgi:GTP cyclohydrolase II